MPLGEKDVQRIAHLARLQLSADEISRLSGELGGILDYIDQLQAVDTDGVDPMSHAVDVPAPLREDRLQPGLSPEEALSEAPDRFQDYVKVPPVIGG